MIFFKKTSARRTQVRKNINSEKLSQISQFANTDVLVSALLWLVFTVSCILIFSFEVIQQKALSFNIDPAVVCSRKELNILLESRGDADYKKSRIFKAWRNEFMQQVYENIETAALLLG